MSPSATECATTPRNLKSTIFHPVFLGLVLAIATVTAYWPVMNAEFINYDDTDYVTENAHVQMGLTWQGVRWAFTSKHASNWHPLTWMSHMLDIELFGNTPAGPHGVNLLLHVANALLLFALLRQISGTLWRSYFVTLLFALHPLHVETVAWISERKDVLSTFFGLLAMISYARFRPASAASDHAGKWHYYGLMLTCYGLSLLSKPMLVTLPFILLLMDYWPLRNFRFDPPTNAGRIGLQLIGEKIPLFIMSAASCLVTAWAQQNAIQSLEHLTFLQRLANAAVAYVRYLGKTFWPTDLALPYPHPGNWPTILVAGAAGLVFAISLFAISSVRHRPYLAVGWFWYLGTLVPVIGLVQVGGQSLADRYTYLPLVGFFICCVWGLSQLAASRKKLQQLFSLAGIGATICCAILCHRQAMYWQQSETLFTHAARITKNNYIALLNVGGTLFAQGRLDEALKYYHAAEAINPGYPDTLNSIGAVLSARNDPRAIDYFRRTLALQTDHSDALFNMGNQLARGGHHEEALDYYQRAIARQPNNSQMRNNLANTLLRLGRTDAAIAEYEAALTNNPADLTVLENLAKIHVGGGQFAKAIPYYQTLVKIAPEKPAPIYALGQALAMNGSWSEAITCFQTASRLAPQNPEIYYNLGYALRMAGHPSNSAEALRAAINLQPNFPLAHYNLGCVLLSLGDRPQGSWHVREALRLNPDYQEARQKLEELNATDSAK